MGYGFDKFPQRGFGALGWGWGRTLADLWDARGGLRNLVNCRLGMCDAAVVVEERVDVTVHKIGVISARILAPGVQWLLEGGGAHPAVWRAELLEQPRRDEVPGAHTPVAADMH